MILVFYTTMEGKDSTGRGLDLGISSSFFSIKVNSTWPKKSNNTDKLLQTTGGDSNY